MHESLLTNIVRLRITELREERIEGLQMLTGIYDSRCPSAMGTC